MHRIASTAVVVGYLHSSDEVMPKFKNSNIIRIT